MTYIGKAVQEFKDAHIEIKVRFNAGEDNEARQKFNELLDHYAVGGQGFELGHTTLERVERMFPQQVTTRIPVVSIPV